MYQLLRQLTKIAFVLLLCFWVGVATLLGLLHTRGGLTLLVNQLPSDVRVYDLRVERPFTWRVNRIETSQAAIDDATIVLKPLPLFLGKIHVEQLWARSVQLKDTKANGSLPTFPGWIGPWSIALPEIEIGNFSLPNGETKWVRAEGYLLPIRALAKARVWIGAPLSAVGELFVQGTAQQKGERLHLQIEGANDLWHGRLEGSVEKKESLLLAHLEKGFWRFGELSGVLQGKAEINEALHVSHFDMVIDVEDLSPIDPLQGKTRWKVTGTPHEQGLVGEVVCEAKELSIQGQRVGDFHLHYKGELFANRITGELEFALGGLLTHFAGKSAISWSPGQAIQLKNLSFDLEQNRIEGSLAYHPQTKALIGDLQAKTETNLQANLHLSYGEELGQQVHGQVEWKRAHLEGITAEKIQLALELSHLYNDPTGTLSLEVEDLAAPGLRIKEGVIGTKVQGFDEYWPVQALVRGGIPLPFRLEVEGAIQPTAHPQLLIQTLEGKVAGREAFLEQPVQIISSPEGVELTACRILVEGGTIELAYSLIEEVMDLDIRANQLPFSITDASIALVGSGEGMLNGHLKVIGPIESPEGSFSAHLLSSTEGAYRKQATSLHLTGSLKEQLAELNGEVTGLEEHPIQFTCSLPIESKKAPPWIHLDPSRPVFEASFYFDGDLSSLLNLATAPAASASGYAHGSLTLSGSVYAPVVSGSVDLSQLSWESLETGAAFTNGSAKIVGQGNRLFLRALTAQDHFGGSVHGEGVMELSLERLCPGEMGVHLHNARVYQKDDLYLSCSGQMMMTGTLVEQKLTGFLTVVDAAATIPERPASSLASLRPRYVNGPPPESTFWLQNQLDGVIQFDITLDFSHGLAIRAPQLNTLWQGRLQLRGSSEVPLYYGELSCNSGGFRLNGKLFRMRAGQLTFRGDLENDTSIYAEATHTLDRTTIAAQLKGKLHTPQLAFFANPPLSQRQILSLLIFNQTLPDEQLRDIDLPVVAVVDIAKGSLSSGGGMIDNLRRIGIDRIDIDSSPADYDDVTVNVGKYLAPGCYVSVNRGVNSDINSVCFQAELLKYVKLQAEVGDDRQGRLLLMWRRDY